MINPDNRHSSGWLSRQKAVSLQRFPFITLALVLLSSAFMLLPDPLQVHLYLDLRRISQGHVWGLVSGHWLHADLQHLLWNVVALAILGSIIELRSRAILMWSLAIGTLFVDLLLLSPLSDIQRYCGLSGILNTLLGTALYLNWRETRSALVILIACLSVIKIVIELSYGHSVFTDFSWPPYPLAHLAGLLATPLVIGCCYLGRTAGKQRAPTARRNTNGHLVTR